MPPTAFIAGSLILHCPSSQPAPQTPSHPQQPHSAAVRQSLHPTQQTQPPSAAFPCGSQSCSPRPSACAPSTPAPQSRSAVSSHLPSASSAPPESPQRLARTQAPPCQSLPSQSRSRPRSHPGTIRPYPGSPAQPSATMPDSLSESPSPAYAPPPAPAPPHGSAPVSVPADSPPLPESPISAASAQSAPVPSSRGTPCQAPSYPQIPA